MKTIHLQFCGETEAKEAIEFSIGEFMKWNGGSTSEIIGIEKETKKTITYKEQWVGFNGSLENGIRKFNKNRLVAIGRTLIK